MDYEKDIVKVCYLLDIPMKVPCLGETFKKDI
jgi:hypothetical protein